MSPEEVDAANQRGNADPTLKAIIEFVTSMTGVTVGEASGFWTARTCNEMRRDCVATFVTAMEKAGTPSEG
jgi:hypothetical protein